MSTVDPARRVSGGMTGPQADRASADATTGDGWLLFAGIALAMAGVLNVIYGIAAIDGSSFFVEDTRSIVSGLNTWGWVTLLLGVLQLMASLSVVRGGQFGRWFGILAASLHAMTALLSLPASPFWSLAVFAIDLIIIYGLAVYGGRRRTA